MHTGKKKVKIERLLLNKYRDRQEKLESLIKLTRYVDNLGTNQIAVEGSQPCSRGVAAIVNVQVVVACLRVETLELDMDREALRSHDQEVAVHVDGVVGDTVFFVVRLILWASCHCC